MEVLDSTEKLVEAESQITKLQRGLENVMKEKVLRPLLLIFFSIISGQTNSVCVLIFSSLETWTPAVQTSCFRRNVLNNYVAAMKLSAG